MRFIRRDLLKLALGTALVVRACPAFALSAPRLTPETIAQRLARDLTAAVREGQGAVFSVAHVQMKDTPRSTIGATVQLDWPPGTRRRPVSGMGVTAEEAYNALLANAKTEFREMFAPGKEAARFG